MAVDVWEEGRGVSVTDDQRHRLLGPVNFPMTLSGLAATMARPAPVGGGGQGSGSRRLGTIAGR
jgi:hypothetical protein